MFLVTYDFIDSDGHVHGAFVVVKTDDIGCAKMLEPLIRRLKEDACSNFQYHRPSEWDEKTVYQTAASHLRQQLEEIVTVTMKAKAA